MINDKEAQRRRRELEEESAFFGSMDGASKFVRGDAVAGLIVLAVNIFGGIIIGVTRHGLALGQAADVFAKLSVGDGLVSQVPALIVSLGAALLVSKGGTRGSANQAVLNQLVHYPRALMVAALLLLVLGILPGLPFLPFGTLGGVLLFVGTIRCRAVSQPAKRPTASARPKRSEPPPNPRIPSRISCARPRSSSASASSSAPASSRRPASSATASSRCGASSPVSTACVVPEIKVTDSLDLPPKIYQIKIHGTVVATQELRLGEVMVITGDGPQPDVPGIEVREPAFGMKAHWIAEAFASEVKRQNFQTIDTASVLLTHLSEVIRNNLAQLLSYRDMRSLVGSVGTRVQEADR